MSVGVRSRPFCDAAYGARCFTVDATIGEGCSPRTAAPANVPARVGSSLNDS